MSLVVLKFVAILVMIIFIITHGVEINKRMKNNIDYKSVKFQLLTSKINRGFIYFGIMAIIISILGLGYCIFVKKNISLMDLLRIGFPLVVMGGSGINLIKKYCICDLGVFSYGIMNKYITHYSWDMIEKVEFYNAAKLQIFFNIVGDKFKVTVFVDEKKKESLKSFFSDYTNVIDN